MTLTQLLALTRTELLSFAGAGVSVDYLYRDGYTGDPRNAEVPVASVSLTERINQANNGLAILTGYKVGPTVLVLVAGTRSYAVSQNIIEIISVELPGYSVRRVNLEDQNRRYPRWRASANGRPNKYILSGLNTLDFDPAPDAAAVTAGCSIIGTLAPTALAATTDTPADLPLAYHYLLGVGGAMLSASVDTANPSMVARYQALVDRFTNGAALLQAEVNKRELRSGDSPLVTSGRVSEVMGLQSAVAINALSKGAGGS